jgi:hypothetical protein
LGLSKNAVQFLLHCRERGVDFSACATIGRQVLYLNAAELRAAFARKGQPISAGESDNVFRSGGNYAEPVLTLLGAKRIDSFDASSYENATKVADFNLPLDESEKAKYSAVIDGGSLEHVFNYPQGLKNAMEMVRPGGHLILITPTHSRSGHGFYQLSPELFYRAFCELNGYDAPEVLLSASTRDKWYRVVDPADIGGRVLINHRLYSDHLFVVARRSRVSPIFGSWPQQSDYASAWGNRGSQVKSKTGVKDYLRANRHRIPRPFLRLYSELFAPASSGLKRIEL